MKLCFNKNNFYSIVKVNKYLLNIEGLGISLALDCIFYMNKATKLAQKPTCINAKKAFIFDI